MSKFSENRGPVLPRYDTQRALNIANLNSDHDPEVTGGKENSKIVPHNNIQDGICPTGELLEFMVGLKTSQDLARNELPLPKLPSKD